MPSITLFTLSKHDREHHSWRYVTQEEISRIPGDVLRSAMSSVHNRLAECEQRNGGYLEGVMFRVGCRVVVLCSVLCFKTTDSLISANAKVFTSLYM